MKTTVEIEIGKARPTDVNAFSDCKGGQAARNKSSLRLCAFALRSALLLFLTTGSLFAANQEFTSWVAIRALDQKETPVTDLKREDLTLEVDKVHQPIVEWFPSRQRQFLIFIDLAFSSPETVGAIRGPVWNFLSSLEKGDVASIAVYDAQSFVRLLCSFTSDRNQWAYALNHMDETVHGEDAAGFYFSADAKQGLSEAFADSSTVQDGLLKVAGTVPKDKDKIHKAGDQFASKVTEFAKALQVVRGEKQILFFSPGIPTRKAVPQEEFGEEEERDLVMVVPDSAPGEVTEMRQTGGRVADSAVQFLAENFIAANCIVHTFDVFALGPSVSAGKDFMKTLAKVTNGSYYQELQAGLNEIKNRPNLTYLIGWNASAAVPQYQEVKISSNRNLKIVAPSRLLTPKTILKFSSIEKQLYLAHWIYTDAPLQKLQHHLLIDWFPLEENLVKTILFLQISGQQLLQEPNSKMRSLYIAGYLMQPDGKLVDYVFTPIRIDTDKNSEALKNSGIKYFDTFISKPGEYQFRGLLVDIEQNHTTVLNTPITVPDFQTLTITNPVVVSANLDWIVLRHEYKDEMKRSVSARYPYEGEKGMFFPDLDPSLQAGATYFLSYSIYNLKVDSQKRPAPQFRFTLQPGQGQGKALSDIVLAERKAISDTNYALMFQFKPPNAGAGEYQLITELTDTLANKKTSKKVAVRLQ